MLFQFFQTCESCPAPDFQENIGEILRKFNRRDEPIMEEHYVEESLTSHGTLILENKWITQDPKSVAFTNVITQSTTIFDF